MVYRGDGEPEYIDDDEFFDPDDAGDSGRRGANVLGGSGARNASEAFSEPREEPARPTDSSRDTRRKPGQRKRDGSTSGRKTVRSRNPAPSVADSEERRARLAGRHQTKARDEDGHKPGAEEAIPKKRRFGGWRQRFSRQGSERQRETRQAPRVKSSRLAAAAGGIRGKLGQLRGHLRRNEAGGSGGQRAGKPSGRGFGASRGASKPPAGRGRDSASSNRTAGTRRDGPAKASKAPKIATDNWLDLDRKLDLIGVGLVFGAIVFVFSALSPEQAAIGGVHTIVGQLLGWGAIALPITMFAVGLWLIIRHFGAEPPIIDPTRLSGAALAFLAALVLLQYIDSIGYPAQCGRECMAQAVQSAYQAGHGGGLVGGWFYHALVVNLTELGGFVALLMAATIAAMLTTRSSIVELSIVAISLSRNLHTRLSQVALQRRAERLTAQHAQPAMAQTANDVRIRKPEPAQLSASPQDGRALPEPRSDWMPIPNRLWAFLGRRAKSDLAHAEESVSLEPAADSKSSGFLKRFRNQKGAEGRPAIAPENAVGGPTGRLERFLNLGDDLPSASTLAPALDKPSPLPTHDRPDAAPKIARAWSQPSTRPEAPPASGSGSADSAWHKPTESADAAAQEPRSDEQPITVQPPATMNENSSEEKDAARDSAESPADEARPLSEDRSQPATPPRAPDSAKTAARIAWDMPDYRGLLNAGTASELDQAAIQQQAQTIEDTLAAFGAPGRVIEVNSGPVITQFGVQPAYIVAKTGKRNRVKVGTIAKLDKDLQLALGARSLRMEAPVPGKGYVGIEVPNPASARVGLRDVMDAGVFQKIDTPLAIALGMSVDGMPIAADLTQMPHLLIAGTTGSGKSVCVNAIINSILANNSPETARFIMVDPKRVELTGYNGLPHLLAPVVVELERILGVLRWVTTEMDQRYKKFSQAGARNIIDYNSILDPDLAAMPYIVVIIDELADLMMMAPDDTERAIARIAALARATGIHLVIATQRPSVDVVTGLIKANCPARIAFAVASSVDSRVIIDQPGAERLLGKGDMLYMSGDTPAPRRVQGVHVSNEEIQRIGRYWKLQKSGIAGIEPIPLPPKASESRPPDAAAAAKPAPKTPNGGQTAFWEMTAANHEPFASADRNPEEDELYQTAVEMVRRLEKASISLLQRRLRIGYTRAARLVDMMEERGVVGPPKEGSSKPRDVLPP